MGVDVTEANPTWGSVGAIFPCGGPPPKQGESEGSADGHAETPEGEGAKGAKHPLFPAHSVLPFRLVTVATAGAYVPLWRVGSGEASHGGWGRLTGGESRKAMRARSAGSGVGRNSGVVTYAID